MSRYFEELDYQATPIGPVSLRRRRILALERDVHEILLGEEHLMSSLFTVSEEALAGRALDFLVQDGVRPLDVAVGGLGLGYTAAAALADPNVAALLVVEYLAPVIDWHARDLVPLRPPLSADPRCRIVEGDFFALAASETGLDPERPRRRFDAVLVDIDHAPDRLLDRRSESFYSPEGLARLARNLKPGGVIGLWSDDRPDAGFLARLEETFDAAQAAPVRFDNPLQPGREIVQTIYLGRVAGGN